MQLAYVKILIDPVTGAVFAQSAVAEACKNQQVHDLINKAVNSLVTEINDLEG